MFHRQRNVSPHPCVGNVNWFRRSDQAHGRLKRILGTGFTNSALAAVEPNIKVHVMKLMNRLHENSLHGPVDLAKWFPCFSFDVRLPHEVY